MEEEDSEPTLEMPALASPLWQRLGRKLVE
jgi:hypothetical protein